MISSIIVFMGGMLGAILRYELSRWLNKDGRIPWGTALANISGGLLLGYLIGVQGSLNLPDWAWLLITVGFCGGYTTFSTFSYEVMTLMKKRAYIAAFIYGMGSTLLTILGAALLLY
ncbi:fluoride efflux transporter CrcB [Halobacillus naozhouensis]|uniref:Fluoride-specific ion channel FluC n=1 Tax=Halobacillus naozhouensis TaxID=554880 RepID=A0ABY8IVC7_9BACI|nr:fluoride efflux transporter CrcB [Halobacillus naozhouensis]WFT73666.1 fluoride efflux transporter CrcB [Halobacillus naozhouensis]